MNFLLEYNFDEEEIKDFAADIPPLLHEQILNSYKLVSKNIEYLKNLGIKNYQQVFINFYDMFLMDSSNFMNVFNKYEQADLVEKINANVDIVEFL